MKTLTANEAKTHFGNLILKAQQHPIQINKNGKPVAVVVSMETYQELDAIKIAMLKKRAKQAEQAINNNTATDGEGFITELASGKYD